MGLERPQRPADPLSIPLDARGAPWIQGGTHVLFDSRWGGRIRTSLILTTLFVMAIAGSAGTRWNG